MISTRDYLQSSKTSEAEAKRKKAAMFETGAKSIIEKILPIVDNFERGVAALSEEDLESPVGQGMNLIYKQLLSTLDEMGVTAIEAEKERNLTLTFTMQ